MSSCPEATSLFLSNADDDSPCPAPPKSVSEEGSAVPPRAAPARTTCPPELVEEVSVAAAPCKPRGPIKRKTGEKPRSHAGDDTSSCPEAPKPAPEDVGVLPPSPAQPVSPSRKRPWVVPCAASSDDVLDSPPAKKGTQEAKHLQHAPNHLGPVASSETMLQEADAIKSPAPGQPSAAEDSEPVLPTPSEVATVSA